MAADLASPQLIRIAEVRGQRLARAAVDARVAADEAAAAVDQAITDRATAERALVEARAAFVTDPACRQARLWLDRCIDRSIASTAEVSALTARLDLAREAQADAVRAVARHEIRGDAVAAHRKQITAAQRRRAEDRAEADQSTTIRTSMI